MSKLVQLLPRRSASLFLRLGAVSRSESTPSVQRVVDRTAVAVRPRGLAACVDDPPHGRGPRAHPDEATCLGLTAPVAEGRSLEVP